MKTLTPAKPAEVILRPNFGLPRLTGNVSDKDSSSLQTAAGDNTNIFMNNHIGRNFMRETAKTNDPRVARQPMEMAAIRDGMGAMDRTQNLRFKDGLIQGGDQLSSRQRVFTNERPDLLVQNIVGMGGPYSRQSKDGSEVFMGDQERKGSG